MVTARRQTRRRIEALRRISLFADCTRYELARIDRLGTLIAVRPGRTLTVEGAIGRECFVTLDGVAVVERCGRPIGTIDAGSVVGEIALLDHTTRNATVVAGTPMRLLVLSEHELEELLRIAPRVETTLRRIADERRGRAPIACAGRDPQLLSVGSH
jgi:CRP-like cAMP-binding protein